MNAHPFSRDRRVGTVIAVEGSQIEVLLPRAAQLPSVHFGERVGGGEVGEFLLVDAGGVGIFGRVSRVSVARSDISQLGVNDTRVMAEGRLQLLATLHMSGDAKRGIEVYPRIGDAVYSAGSEVIQAVVATADARGTILMGSITQGPETPIWIPWERLLGRHLAIVGTTGSGKSWTLAHIAESIYAAGGKLLLIDATGEFKSLGSKAKHLSFGSCSAEEEAALVGIPHFLMRETDRQAFLNPSAGSQLPKLREAVKSLRLARALIDDEVTTDFLTDSGNIVKADKPRAQYEALVAGHLSIMEDPKSPFDILCLPDQILYECIWPTTQSGALRFGSTNANEVGYVSTLVSRINVLLQMPEVMEVIDPATDVANALDEIEAWLDDDQSRILRLSLRNLTFANYLREIVVNIVGQRLLELARGGGFGARPLAVAIDEAHQFFDVTLGDEFSKTRLDAFSSISKEGRKYGLTLCVATQRPSDLPAGVLSQVGMMIVHRIADGSDRQKIEVAAAELDISTTRLLPGLVPGEALLMGSDFPIPVSVMIEKPISKPTSTGPNYLSGWGTAN